MSWSASIYQSGQATNWQEKQMQWLSHLVFLGLGNVSNNPSQLKKNIWLTCSLQNELTKFLILSLKQTLREKNEAYCVTNESYCVQIIVL